VEPPGEKKLIHLEDIPEIFDAVQNKLKLPQSSISCRWTKSRFTENKK
jgi:hypothetical protein